MDARFELSLRAWEHTGIRNRPRGDERGGRRGARDEMAERRRLKAGTERIFHEMREALDALPVLNGVSPLWVRVRFAADGDPYARFMADLMQPDVSTTLTAAVLAKKGRTSFFSKLRDPLVSALGEWSVVEVAPCERGRYDGAVSALLVSAETKFGCVHLPGQVHVKPWRTDLPPEIAGWWLSLHTSSPKFRAVS